MDIVRPDYPQGNPEGTPELDSLRAALDQPAEPRKRLPAAVWIGAAVALSVLLGAGVFMAIRLGLLGGPAMQSGGGPAFSMQSGGGPAAGGMLSLAAAGGADHNVWFTITPAPELPTTPPDVSGMFSRRDGDSLFIHQGIAGCVATGGAPVAVGTGSGPATAQEFGTVSVSGPETGPEVEVVVGKDTKIYEDVTKLPDPTTASGSQTIQQKVEPVKSLDDVKNNTIVTVWGDKQGDKFIARTILLGEMFSITLANGGTLPPPDANGPVVHAVQITITAAPELPSAAPDAFGIFSRRDGNSLFLHQGPQGCVINMNFASVAGTSSGPGTPAVSGPVTASASWPAASGPEVEIVVGKDTKIYKDVTSLPDPATASGSQTIQQKVELVTSLDDIKPNTMLTVWGKKQGDKFIATTILFSEMVKLPAPPQ